MAQQQKQKIGNRAKGRQSSRHKAKRALAKYRTFANVQRRRNKHRAAHPNDAEINKAVRWLKSS